jgi:uncharacterized membrane protein HdeD (DUF308 family)
MARSKSSSSPRRTRQSRRSAAMVFTSGNYKLLLVGLLLILVGYVIMRVENQVDGFLSLYIAPALILGGYLEIIYAILWRPKAASEKDPQAA